MMKYSMIFAAAVSGAAAIQTTEPARRGKKVSMKNLAQGAALGLLALAGSNGAQARITWTDCTSGSLTSNRRLSINGQSGLDFDVDTPFDVAFGFDSATPIAQQARCTLRYVAPNGQNSVYSNRPLCESQFRANLGNAGEINMRTECSGGYVASEWSVELNNNGTHKIEYDCDAFTADGRSTPFVCTSLSGRV